MYYYPIRFGIFLFIPAQFGSKQAKKRINDKERVTMKKIYSNLDNTNSSKSFKEVRKWQKERKAKVKNLSVHIAHFLPMHYGTYRLANDTGPEALERLILEWKKRQLPKQQLKILLLGESVM
jgi:hypothetical protein